MLLRSLTFVSALALLAGACSWPPNPSVPAAPARTAQQTADQGTDRTGRAVDETVGTVDRTVGAAGRTTGGITGGLPAAGGGGGGGLLR